MKISIALCTFNGAEFVREQLESIAEQTRIPDEIVVSDDRSCDRTASIVENFARHSIVPVRLVVNDSRLGVIKNFDQTIARCDGDLIFLCDQDDVWHRHKIERISTVFEEDNVMMVFSDADIVDINLESLSNRLSSVTFLGKVEDKARFNIFESILRGNIVTGMTMAFRSDLRELAQPIPSNLPGIIHDGWLSLVASLCGKCMFLDQSLVMYRQHAHQLVGAANLTSSILKTTRKKQIAGYTIDANYQIDRLQRIQDRLDDQVFDKLERDVVDDATCILDEKIQFWENQKLHLQWRSGLSPHRLMRLPGIAAKLVQGKYSKFSNGVRSALKDLYLP